MLIPPAWRRPPRACALIALWLCACPLLAPSRAAARPMPPMSAAGEELCAVVRAAGGLKSNPWVSAVLERRRLRELLADASHEPAAVTPSVAIAETPYLGVDQLATFDPPGCICSSRGPYLTEAEPSVAMWGHFVVGSWNDNRSRCTPQSSSQGWGYSIDGGRTWVDKGTLPVGPGPTDFHHGDPVVSANEKLGRFYIAGIHRAGSLFAGVSALRGHFEADTFKVDQHVIVALPEGEDFLDKPWMVADSASGNVYVTWTNFRADGSVRIELQRLDPDLAPLGPLQVLEDTDGLVRAPQGTFPKVGPDGELYVPWTEYTVPFSGTPARIVVRKSVDFGATFGPLTVVRTCPSNPFSGGPGSLRTFGSQNVSLAVDRTNGPHRGRAYLAWDEPAEFEDAPFGEHTAGMDQDYDASFAGATPFVPGGKLRGSVVAGERDLYRFDGVAGQLFVMRGDSVAVDGAALRVICSSDTASQAVWHVLANTGVTSGGIVVGLPYTGTYYIVITSVILSGPTGSYVLGTAFDTPTFGDTGRDQRDVVLSYSDGGAAWSPAQRINDSGTGFDSTFPTLTVDGLGRVHAAWLDWRDGPGCGDLSNVFMTSSGDGGTTWAPNRRLSDHTSFWGLLASCSAANHGDYIEMASSGDRLVTAFPDSRLGNPDVWIDGVRMSAETVCPAGGTVLTGGDWVVTFAIANTGSFDTPRAWAVSDTRGWLAAAVPALSGQQTIAANGGVLTVTATVHGPIGCGGDSTAVGFISSDPFVAGAAETCAVVVRCRNSAGAPPGDPPALAFAHPAPNPSAGAVRLRYTLSRPGFLLLEVLDVQGARVRTLARGAREAGPHEAVWDGTDDRGRALPSGVYWARLVAEGHTLRRTILRTR